METLQSASPTPIGDTSTLGDLLCEVRSEAGLTVEDLSRRGGLSIDRIREIESSRYGSSPAELAAVIDAYGVATPCSRLSRRVVVISLEDGWISMRATRRIWEKQAEADQNLLRYLGLLYQHRDLPLGERVPLRSVDLALLRGALALRRPEVEAHLDRIGRSLPERLHRDKSLLAVAAVAGVAVAAGAIILLPGAGTAGFTSSVDRATVAGPATQSIESAAASADPDIDIGTALVVERAPVQPTELDSGVSNPDSSVAPVIDPRIDIGTALVIERPAGQADDPVEPVNSSRTSRGPPYGGTTSPKGNN